MDKAIIYYFSGTGNSLYLAKDIAMHLNGELVPIASTIEMEQVIPEGAVIGIIYPVYYNDLPVIVREFALKLHGIDGRYVFAICNYGGCGSQSVKSLGVCIKNAGGALSVAYGVHMPQNAFFKPWESNGRLIKKAAAKVGKIAQDVKARRKGYFLRGPLNVLFVRLHQSLVPRIRADLIKKTGLPPETDLDLLVRANDSSFSANGKCVGCGQCEKVCPVGNIIIRDEQPTWGGRCENCLACYNWCPQKAIEGGVASKGYYYVNSKVNASDMMAQKKTLV